MNNFVKRNLELIEKDTSKVLGLKLGSKDVTRGIYIPKASKSCQSTNGLCVIADSRIEAQYPPKLYFDAPSAASMYIVIGLDIDTPFPAFGPLDPIPHWIQPGLKVTPPASGSSALPSGEPFVANYIGPAPPPLRGPYRYFFFLYEQPVGFDAKKYAPPGGKTLGNFDRMRYDLDAFVKEAELGPALAFNYFRSN